MDRTHVVPSLPQYGRQHGWEHSLEDSVLGSVGLWRSMSGWPLGMAWVSTGHRYDGAPKIFTTTAILGVWHLPQLAILL
jgi:hypothetical protein